MSTPLISNFLKNFYMGSTIPIIDRLLPKFKSFGLESRFKN